MLSSVHGLVLLSPTLWQALPRPSVFLVSQEKRLLWRSVQDLDQRQAEPADILQALQPLAG